MLAGLVAQVLLSRDLHRTLDADLRDRAAQVAQLAVSAPALVTRPAALASPLAPRELEIAIYDAHGRLAARSPSLGDRLLPVQALVSHAIRTGSGGYADVTVAGGPARVYVAPLAELGGGPVAGGAVAVAATTGGVDEILDTVRGILALAGVAAILAGGVAAVLLCRRALRPLHDLTAAAARVGTTADPSGRLPAPGASGEVQQLTDTLNAMLAALERASAEQGRFVADASHELRTPITALRGNIEYLLRHGASGEALEEARLDAERLSRLVDELLALARADARPAARELVELGQLARALAAPDGRVEAIVDGEAWVEGDQRALERAVENLVSNALHHGPPEGAVRIVLEARDGRALLAVEDDGDGLGVPLEQAVGRFWRGENSRGAPGAGLGLPIVAATAQAHGGRLTAKGARFVLELPLSDRSQTRPVERGAMNDRKDPR